MTQRKVASRANQTCLLCALALSLTLRASAAVYTYSFSGPFVNNGAGAGVIPDNSIVGLADVHSLSGMNNSISDVVLTVHLAGTAIDDLQGYIRLGDTTTSPSVSLNSSLTCNNNDFSLHLSSFAGLNPNNTWTLFFADQSPGGQNTLSGWSLDVTAVPEPLNLALGLFGVVVAGAGGTRWYLTRRKLQHRAYIWPL